MRVNVNVTHLRREAHDSRYSHMIMEPVNVMWLCDEITKLRAKVVELGGDPYDLEPKPAPTEESTEPAQADDNSAAVSLADVLSVPNTVIDVLPGVLEQKPTEYVGDGGEMGGAGATEDFDAPKEAVNEPEAETEAVASEPEAAPEAPQSEQP